MVKKPLRHIPYSHGAASKHLLLILGEAGRRGRAEVQEVVLEARDPGREHLEPFGRDEGQDNALGGDAVLGGCVSISSTWAASFSSLNAQHHRFLTDLQYDVIGADAV
jgi:hypothetical protein